MTNEQRAKKGVRLYYKMLRRSGQPIGDATWQAAIAGAVRLFSLAAIMEASDWKLDPIALARRAAYPLLAHTNP